MEDWFPKYDDDVKKKKYKSENKNDFDSCSFTAVYFLGILQIQLCKHQTYSYLQSKKKKKNREIKEIAILQIKLTRQID